MDFKKGLKDVKQKIELQMFDPKGRKPNAYGGIAGQLHLNQGGRARFAYGSPAVDPRMKQSYQQNIAENEAARELNAAMRSADPNAPGGSLTDIYNKYSLGHGTTLGSAFHTGANPREYMSYDTSRHADIIKVMAQRKAQEERDKANTQRVQQIEAEKAEAQERAKGQQIESAIKSAYGLDTMEGKKYGLEAEMLGMPTAAYMDYLLTGNPKGIAELGGTGNEYINPYNVYYSQELARNKEAGLPAGMQIQYGQVMAPPWSSTAGIGAIPSGPPSGQPPSMYMPYADALSSYKQQYQTMNQPFTIGGYGAPKQSTWAEYERQWGNQGGLAQVLGV